MLLWRDLGATGVIACLLRVALAAASAAPTVTDWGLNQLHDHPNASIDLVFIHGLDGHWRSSWTAHNGVFWPRDLMPKVLPESRIFAFAYDARTKADTPLPMDVYDHATELVGSLANEREITDTASRPIIFLAHSLGGIVVKAALIHSKSAGDGHLSHHAGIINSTYAVLFFGTPHQGGEGIGLAKFVAYITSATSYTNLELLDHLKKHSNWLQEQQSKYGPLSRRFHSVFFFETQKMAILSWNHLLKILVVPKYSAVVQGAVNAESASLAADHSSMVKYASELDPNFVKVLRYLRRFVKDATRQRSGVVPRGSTATEPTTEQGLDLRLPVGVDCPEFCLSINLEATRNQKFVGRELEMDLIDRWFTESKSKGEVGVVILDGLGGVGKTQIAIEYSYRRRTKFSSIFWFDGSSNVTLSQSMKRAALDVKSHYEVHGLVGGKSSYDYLSQVSASSSASRASSGESPEGPDLITPFLRWLLSPQNQRWLLIFDNVDDLESFDWTRYLPKTQWGSVLLTSRRSDLALNWRAIPIEPMSKEDAIKLLEESSHISIYEDDVNLYHAQRLVHKLGYFPLAIAQAGAYISLHKTRDPFATYIDLYENRPAVMLDRRAPGEGWNYRKDTVLTTWEISFDAIRRQKPEAAVIFELCGFLYRDEIQEAFLLRGLGLKENDTTVGDSISLMLSYSLVQLLYSEEGRYLFTIHPLVHTWLRERLDIEDRRKRTHDSVVLFYRAFGFAPYNHTVRLYRNSPDRAFDIGRNHLSEIVANCVRYPSPGIPREVVLQPPAADDTTSYHGLLRYWLEGYYLWSQWFVVERVRYVLYQLRPDPSRLASWDMIYQIDQRTDFLRYTSESFAFSFQAWIVKEIWAQYPLKHPLSLRSIGVYIDKLIVPESPTLDLATAWFTWLLAARQQVLGKSHPATMGAYIGLGRILLAQGHCEESVRYLEEAYFVRNRVLGPGDKLTNRAWELLRESVETCPNYGNLQLFSKAFEEAGANKDRILRKTPLAVLYQAARRYVLAEGKPVLALEILSFFFYPRPNHVREDAELDYLTRALDIGAKIPQEVLLQHVEYIVGLLVLGFRDDGGLEDVEIAMVAARMYVWMQDADKAAIWMRKASELLDDEWLTPSHATTWGFYHHPTAGRSKLTDVLRRFFRIWGLPATADSLYRWTLPMQDYTLQKRWFELINDIVGLCLADMVQLDFRARFARQTNAAARQTDDEGQSTGVAQTTSIYYPHFLESTYRTGLLVRCVAMGKLWLPFAKRRWGSIDGVYERLELLEDTLNEDKSTSCFSDLRYTFECPAHWHDDETEGTER